jgi:putative hydrolase of the HAD superfamily
MVIAERMDIVVVIDLDDTLYAEYDYQTSGIRAVSKVITELYGQDITDQILSWRDEGERDLWGRACLLLDLPVSVKETLLWIYRLHDPELTLAVAMVNALSQISSIVKDVVILTDGRSVSQRKKIHALGLEDFHVYISEEYQSKKPDPIKFKAIMRDFPAFQYLYVGDNPKKDFIAPNALGWKTVGLSGGLKNIHAQTTDGLPSGALPDTWINSLSEMIKILRSDV